MWFYPLIGDIWYGNIYVFLAAMVVAGRRHPEAFALGLLTKVTPGVGIAYYLGARDWRALARAGVATGALVLVSIAIQGVGVWAEWIAMLLRLSSAPIPVDALAIPLLPRILVATGLALWAGATRRYWIVPLVTVIAIPTLWEGALVPLVAFAARDVRSAHLADEDDREYRQRGSVIGDGKRAAGRPHEDLDVVRVGEDSVGLEVEATDGRIRVAREGVDERARSGVARGVLAEHDIDAAGGGARVAM